MLLTDILLHSDILSSLKEPFVSISNRGLFLMLPSSSCFWTFTSISSSGFVSLNNCSNTSFSMAKSSMVLFSDWSFSAERDLLAEFFTVGLRSTSVNRWPVFLPTGSLWGRGCSLFLHIEGVAGCVSSKREQDVSILADLDEISWFSSSLSLRFKKKRKKK